MRRNPPEQIRAAEEFYNASAVALLEAEKEYNAAVRRTGRAAEAFEKLERSLKRAKREYGARSAKYREVQARHYKAAVEYTQAERAEDRADRLYDKADAVFAEAVETRRESRAVEKKLKPFQKKAPPKKPPKEKPAPPPEVPPEEFEEEEEAPPPPPAKGWSEGLQMVKRELDRHVLPLEGFLQAERGPQDVEVQAAYPKLKFLSMKRLDDEELGMEGEAGAMIASDIYLWAVVRMPAWYAPFVDKKTGRLKSPTPADIARMERLREEAGNSRSYIYALKGLPAREIRRTIKDMGEHLLRPDDSGDPAWESIYRYYANQKGLPGIQPVSLVAWCSLPGAMVLKPKKGK